MESELYAVCQNCSAIFTVNNLIGGNGVATLTFTNCDYGPCPNCSGKGKIPDGEYQFSNNVVKFIKGSNFSTDLLNKLKNYFENADTYDKNKAQVINEINKISPEFASIIETNKEVDYHKWINTIIMILTFLMTAQQNYFKNEKIDDAALTNKILIELLKQNNNNQKIISQNTEQLIKNQNILRNYKIGKKKNKSW